MHMRRFRTVLAVFFAAVAVMLASPAVFAAAPVELSCVDEKNISITAVNMIGMKTFDFVITADRGVVVKNVKASRDGYDCAAADNAFTTEKNMFEGRFSGYFKEALWDLDRWIDEAEYLGEEISPSFDPAHFNLGTIVIDASNAPAGARVYVKGVIRGERNYAVDVSVAVNAKPETYTVSYNANGGSGAPGKQTKTQGKALTLSGKKPTRSFRLTCDANGGSVKETGKTLYASFKGWNTKQDGSGVSYAAGALYKTDGGATLYAQWTFPKAGALPTPVRAGWVFTGWYTAKKGGEAVTADRAVKTDMTVYARWQAKLMGDLDENGEVTAADARLALRGAVGLERFDGDRKTVADMNADKAVTAADARLILRTAVGLELTWRVGESVPPRLFFVSFYAQGGTNAPKTQKKTAGQDLTLSAAKPKRSWSIHFDANGGSVSKTDKQVSAVFDSWNTAADGGGARYLPGGVYRTDADLALYAVWTAAKAGDLPAPTRDGFRFTGWFTAKEGGSRIDKDSAVSDNMTLFAHWDKAFTVVFDANGGSDAPNAQTKQKGQSVALNRKKPVKTYRVRYAVGLGQVTPTEKTVSCVFKGWNTRKDGKGVPYAPGDVYKADADLALYAQWENPKLGALPVPTHDLYDFGGWYTANKGGDPVDKNTAVTGDMTIHAHWKASSAQAKANKLVGTWGEESYSYITITSLADGAYRADAFIYRVAYLDRFYGTANRDGTITFSGTTDEGSVRFRVEPNGTGSIKMVVLSSDDPRVCKRHYYFDDPGAGNEVRLADVWEQLTWDYWLKKPAWDYNNNDCLVFDYMEENTLGYYRIMVAPSRASEAYHAVVVDESTLRGDLNGIFTFDGDELGFMGIEGRATVSVDVSKLSDGTVRFKYGSEKWQTFSYAESRYGY